MGSNKGYLVFMLHAHLPYVLNHGRWPHGTDWLNEAAAETYLPLLSVLRRLEADGIRSALTIDLSPVLAEQMALPAFPEEFRSYLRYKISAARQDYMEFKGRGEREMMPLAEYWEGFYQQALEFFEKLQGDLIGEFRRLQEAEVIEIMTCAATHGYLPLLASDASLRLQIETACASYRRLFGRAPRGIWLPECG